MSAVDGGLIILLNHGRSGGLQQVPGNAVYIKASVEQYSVRPCPPSLQEFHTCWYCPPPPLIVWRCTWAMPFVGRNVCITMLHCTLLISLSTAGQCSCMHVHTYTKCIHTYRVWTNKWCMVAVMKCISHEWWQAMQFMRTQLYINTSYITIVICDNTAEVQCWLNKGWLYTQCSDYI